MPPKNSTKLFICPKCQEEIKPITKFVKSIDGITKEKEILSYFNHEINKINYEDFIKSSFNIKSVQSCALKILFQSLSKYLDEIVLKITEKQISFLKVSEDNVMFHLNLNFLNFEYYLVNENKSVYNNLEEIKESEVIYLKVDLKEIKPVVKNIKNDDLITFRKEKNCDFWELIIHNNEKQTNSTYKFKNNVDKISEIKINSKGFKCNLFIPYDLIDETIKKIEFLLPEEIVININEQYLDFSAENNEKTISCENKIFFSENGSINNSSEEYKTKIINGKYNFNKYRIIQSFLNLCNCINIFTNQGDVLISSVTVASLGTLKICIPPLNH